MLASWALLGRLLGLSWGVLGGSWAFLGPSWASYHDLSATLGPLGPLWGSPGPFLDRLSAFLGREDVPEAHVTHPRSSWEVSGAAGKLGVRALKKPPAPLPVRAA